MTATESTRMPDTNGFPQGYFVIRSLASENPVRVLDVCANYTKDGAEIILYAEKEKYLVDNRRNPEANNQVFFVDDTGALCSRSSGHAIDIEGDQLVLRHRRPLAHPYPNCHSHPLPKFVYSPKTGEISVHFSCDPSYPWSSSDSAEWKNKTYLLASVPLRKPKGLMDDISTALQSPLNLFGGSHAQKRATLEEMANRGIDLAEDEVLEEERGEEAEVDDSPELMRKVRMITTTKRTEDDHGLLEKAKNRRQWEVVSIRTADARTGGI
ncbi:WD40 repeat-like protein [Moniliophthora roreri MCA 2997]|uniref:WD40 repeat-like protein n=2 Tax=Moniliophthora roreri TaxID=221103 RepID=V2WV62_MONRO|nr:WD40 repeat-like protein [Moniliophthora roreri MCA 2997]KAI3622011.1 WD40 repeat-like protein [Moniliophthora roreri]